jgi:selenocysteine-specific elongation factor
MKTLPAGVIGHVDHGKTSLVRALTGIDTDRLPEEKARGMSIVPGYAWLELAGGCIELIDVPGHRDFVRNMVAGACGIEALLLVVDAGEGVCAQTREHLEIARLLGVRRGVIVVTKCDRAAPEAAAAQARQWVERLGFEPMPVVSTSALTGVGLADLSQQLTRWLADLPVLAEKDSGYLPIDRVFTLPGHGTVVTGTLRMGALARGAEVEILPRGERAIVRALEAHGRALDKAHPGQRVGVNLRGVKREALARGAVLCSPNAGARIREFDARMEGRLPRPGERIQLLIGTASVPARVRTLGDAFARVRVEESICALPGERFILRRGSETLGGGRVLEAAARRPQKARLALIARALQGRALLLASELPQNAPCEAELEERLLGALAAFHDKHPTEEGASLPWCRATIGERAQAVLDSLERKGAIVIGGARVHLAGFDALGALPDAERALAAEIERAFRDSGLQPPEPRQVTGGDERREALYRLLLTRGRLVRAGPVVFHREAIARLHEALASAYPPPAQFTVSQARELVGSTRKYMVPLLELLDASRQTRRTGDLRSLRIEA